MFVQCAFSGAPISVSQLRQDGTQSASTSGRSELMGRDMHRKSNRMRLSCSLSSLTGRLAALDDFTLIRNSDDILEIHKTSTDDEKHAMSLLLPHSHHVNGQHVSHSHDPDSTQDLPFESHFQSEGRAPGTTLTNHRLQPWSSNPRHVSAILLRTNSLFRLERILDQHSPFLNARHISLALSLLPDIADGSRKSQSPSRQEDSTRSHGWTHQESASYARAKRVTVLSLATRLSSAFVRYLSEYEPRDFAGAARALGKIECTPPGDDGGQRWIERVLLASLQGEGLKRFQSRELATFLWGLANIKSRKSEGSISLPILSSRVGLEWISKARERALEIAKDTEAALVASPQGWEGLGGSVASPQGLCVILWSLAILSQDTSDLLPQDAQMKPDDIEPEDIEVEPSGRLQDETVLLPASWIDEYLAVLSNPTVIRSLDSKNVCMSMAALARCSSGSSSYRPPPASVHRLLHRLLSQRSSSPSADDPRCIVEALWSLAKLGFRPGKDVMSRLCHASKGLLVSGRMCGKGAVILIWSLAVLKVEPEQLDDAWLMEYEQATMNLIGSDLTPQGLSLVVWAMSKVGFRPGFAWMDAVITASQDMMSELGPHSLSLLASSLVTLKYTPRPSWTLSLISAATRALPHASPISLTLTAYSIAKMAWTFFGKHGKAGPSSSSSSFLRPSQKAVCAAFVDVLMLKSGRVLRRQQYDGHTLPSAFCLDSRDMAILMWSIAKISRSASGPKGSAVISSSWLAAATSVSSELLPEASTRDTSLILFAATRLSRGQSAVVSPLVESAVRRLSWIVRHEPHEVNLQDISNALWSLAALRYMPPKGAALLDSDLIALLSAAQELVQMASCSNHDQDLSQLTWSLVRMTAHEPSLLRHPQLSSLVASLISASQDLFVAATREGAGQLLSLLSAWTLIAGLSQLTLLSNSPFAHDGTSRSSSQAQTLVLSQEWIRAATDAAAVAATSPRSRNSPPRQRVRMNDGIVLALQELGALPEGDEGLSAWQDCVRSDAYASREGVVGDWEEPFLRGTLTPRQGSLQVYVDRVSVSQKERNLMLHHQMLAMGVEDDSSDEEHQW